MKYIVKYQNFNESKGISDSCEIITNKIWICIEEDLINKKSKDYIFSFNESDFIIKDLKLSIKLINGTENLCNGITNFNNSFINNNILVDSKMDIEIVYLSLDDPFLYYIKSTILHEILHVFQHYNLKISNKFRPEYFSIGSIISQVRKSIKTKYVIYIIDVIYHSLTHELSAQLHQYYLYKKDNRDYYKLDNILKLLSNFYVKDDLTPDEEGELEFVREHILKGIQYYTTNKKYKKDILNSIWSKKSNIEFIIGLSDIIEEKIKWMEKKRKLIDSKIGIRYDETFTFYGELDSFDSFDSSIFIIENLNNCPTIDLI